MSTASIEEPRASERRTSPAMKWWGWGLEDVVFTHDDKPGLGPFIKEHLDLDVDRVPVRPPAFEHLTVPEPVIARSLQAELEAAVGDDHVSLDPLDRVVHARGKSLQDLVLQRRGDLGRIPDLVAAPADESQVS